MHNMYKIIKRTISYKTRTEQRTPYRSHAKMTRVYSLKCWKTVKMPFLCKGSFFLLSTLTCAHPCRLETITEVLWNLTQRCDMSLELYFPIKKRLMVISLHDACSCLCYIMLPLHVTVKTEWQRTDGDFRNGYKTVVGRTPLNPRTAPGCALVSITLLIQVQGWRPKKTIWTKLKAAADTTFLEERKGGRADVGKRKIWKKPERSAASNGY